MGGEREPGIGEGVGWREGCVVAGSEDVCVESRGVKCRAELQFQGCSRGRMAAFWVGQEYEATQRGSEARRRRQTGEALAPKGEPSRPAAGLVTTGESRVLL